MAVEPVTLFCCAQSQPVHDLLALVRRPTFGWACHPIGLSNFECLSREPSQMPQLQFTCNEGGMHQGRTRTIDGCFNGNMGVTDDDVGMLIVACAC